MSDWYLYLIRTRNGSLYTGITTDVTRRITEHRQNKGSKYLRGRGPLRLVFKAKIGSQSAASKIEAKVKRLSKAGKEALVAGTASDFYATYGF